MNPPKPPANDADLIRLATELSVKTRDVGFPHVSVENELWVSYSRYSTRRQKETSIKQQDQSTSTYAGRLGLQPHPERHRFSDREQSGAYLLKRKGLRDLRELARTGAFKYLLVYDLSRLSRNLLRLLEIHEELRSLGVEIHVTGPLGTGRVDDITATIHGLFAQEERVRLLQTTSEAKILAADDGRNMGRVPYGYRRGDAPGTLVVYEPEATVIRRIFVLYDKGISANQICRILNAEEVPAPDGLLWRPERLIGNNGLLRITRYVGIYIFGRTETQRSPDGAKTIQKVRSAGPRVRRFVPAWRIVEDVDLWIRVVRRLLGKKEHSDVSRPPREKHSSKGVLVFHGAYVCSCGKAMSHKFFGTCSVQRLICLDALVDGCSNKGRLSARWVELELLREIRDNILSEEAHRIFVENYVDENRRIQKQVALKAATLNGRIQALEKLLEDSIVDAVNRGCASDDLVAMREKWTAEKKKCADKIAQLPPPSFVREVDPSMIATLRQQIEDLILRMPLRPTTERDHLLVATLRKLVTSVQIMRTPGSRDYTLRITSQLAALGGPSQDGGEVEAPSRVTIRECQAPRSGNPFRIEQDRYYAELASTNRFGLTGKDWLVLEPLLREAPFDDARRLVDAALFYLRSGCALARLPPPFAGMTEPVRRMVRKGWWRVIHDALETVQSDAVAGLDLRPFVRLEKAGGRRTGLRHSRGAAP